MRVINDSLGVAVAGVGPALMFPVAEIFVVHEFDAREPFGHFHAVTARHEDAERKTMHTRERFAINVVGEKICGFVEALDGWPDV